MKRQKEAVITILILIIVLLSGLMACSSRKTQVTSRAAEKKDDSIQVWAWDDTFNAKAAQLAADRYRQKHPDAPQIKVTTKEREEILSDVKLLLSSQVYDQLPDVIMIEDYDVQDVLQHYENEFVALDECVDYDNYVDYKCKLVEHDGSSYGIPFDCGTAALFYRLDILERAGFSEADMQDLTWSRYMQIGRQVYEKTGTPMLTLDPTDLPLVRIIMQSCGKWYVRQDGVTADIRDNQALRQALEIYTCLLKENLGVSVNGWNEFISAFQNGDVASVISGGWILSSIKASGNQSGKWRITRIPLLEDNVDAVPASNVGGSAWYILKNSAHTDAAVSFMTEMFAEDTEFMNLLMEKIGVVPLLKDLSVFDSYHNTDDFFGGQSVTRLLNSFASMVPTVNYGSKTYDIEDILEAEFQNEFSDGNMDSCLERVQMKAEAVVRE